jgi:hypothetical protein
MATVTKTTAVDLAAQLIANKTNPAAMLKIARRGARLFPAEVLPGGETFDSLAAKIQGMTPTAKPAQRPAAPARKSAPVKAAPAEVAPVVESAPTVETQTLTLVHDGESQTAIFGVEKASPAHLALGKRAAGGLGWGFWPANKSWYIRGSQGFAPDMAAIREAVTRLESLKRDGVQLYRVDQQITATDAQGNPLPSKRTKAEAAEWQHAYDAAFNGGNWALSISKGQCVKCNVEGLTVQTGRLIKDDQGIPRVNCATCGGFDAPKVEPVVESAPEPVAELAEPVAELAELVAMLALPAATEREDCHACKTSVAVVDGKYALHSDPRGGACRARRGVVSEDPIMDEEPVVEAAPRTRRSRKPSAADLGIVVTPATGLSITFQPALSGVAVKNAATEVRQILTAKVKGVKIETRRDKATKRLVLTVIEGGEGFDADALTDKIVAAAKSVRGVANRVHAA